MIDEARIAARLWRTAHRDLPRLQHPLATAAPSEVLLSRRVRRVLGGTMVPVVVGIVALAAGIAAGFLIRKTMAASDAQSIEARAQKSPAWRPSARPTRPGCGRSRRLERKSATMRREAEEDVRARREEIVAPGEPDPGVGDGPPQAGLDDRVADARAPGARREAPVRSGAAGEGGRSASGAARSGSPA